MENGLVTTENKSKDKVDRMVDYINDQYDDTFEFVNEYGGIVFGTRHSIHVSSEKFPNRYVSVYCDLAGEDEVFYDNYLDVKYEEQTRETLNKVLKQYFGENVFVAYSPSTSAYKGGEKSFDEYIADDNPIRVFFSALIESSSVDINEIEEKLKKLFAENKISCSGKLYFSSDCNKIKELKEEEYSFKNFFINGYDASIEFKVTVVDGVSDTNWEIKS